jgi:hypothetical protein
MEPTTEEKKPPGIVLPTEVTPASRINAKNLLLFGLPKSGKTTSLTGLKNCLVVDTEEGSDFVALTKIAPPKHFGPVAKMKWLKDLAATIRKAGCPYDYVVIDTLTQIDEWAEWSGTKKYMDSIAGKKFNRAEDGVTLLKPNDPNYESVHNLPNGYGYRWSRQEMIDIYETYQGIGKICTIFICHVMDKIVVSKLGNTEVKAMDISLTGKVRDIITRRADGIGYVYNSDGVINVSFKGNEDKIGGIRGEHMRGYNGPLDWGLIFKETV